MTKTIKKVFFLAALINGVAIASPANTQQLDLQTSESKRKGETALSYLVTWRKGESRLYNANGLTFINGTEMAEPTSSSDAAYKLSKAINGAIDHDSPHLRGALASNQKSTLSVGNRDGFDLTRITVRDYSNQELEYALAGKEFDSSGVDIAIDLVYSAEVEYVKGFSKGIEKATAGGFVSVTIDSNAPIKIITNGKSNEQIEKELAKAIGSNAKYSSSPIFPNFEQIRSKNYKSFDGGELQILGLKARRIVIDVNDAGLGVLTKFDFTQVEKPVDMVNNLPYIIGLLLAGIFAYLFFFAAKKKD
ncbi:MAG: hypothetical protein PSN04_07405 [Methyloprofundus sp.]|nr:hypothetical protein [Methyloprofundus sp.]